jgi:hypothetical protein
MYFREQGEPNLIKAAEPARDRTGWQKRRWRRRPKPPRFAPGRGIVAALTEEPGSYTHFLL